jgi:hypothetical protein
MREAVGLLQTRDCKAASDTEGWRKEIGEAMT